MKTILLNISLFIYEYINKNLGLKIREKLIKRYADSCYWNDIKITVDNKEIDYENYKM